MSEPSKRVFCKDCQNYLGSVMTMVPGGLPMLRERACKVAVVYTDPIRGDVAIASDASKRNENFDCPHWTPKGAERIRPGNAPPPKRPWWRFWE